MNENHRISSVSPLSTNVECESDKADPAAATINHVSRNVDRGSENDGVVGTVMVSNMILYQLKKYVLTYTFSSYRLAEMQLMMILLLLRQIVFPQMLIADLTMMG